MLCKKSKKNTKKVYEIWEVLEKFGKFQIMQYIYICLPTVFITMGHINYIFVVGDVNYRCRVPECEAPEAAFQAQWWPNRTIDRCHRPVLNVSSGLNCSSDGFGNQLEQCTEWVYENHNTVVSALDLACKSWQINSVGTVHNSGMLIAMLVTGWLADKFGRKYIVTLGMLATTVGVFKIFATSYYTYILVEFFEAVLGGGSYSSATLIMIEITGTKYRVLSGVIYAYAIYMGEMLFAVVAMLVPYWKTLVLITYLPTGLCFLLAFVLIESPRWQILNSKTEDVVKNYKYIAETNKINVDLSNLAKLDAVKLREVFKIKNYDKSESTVEIFKSREMMKRVLVGSCCRFTSNFVYYGIMINSVWLPGDKYTNFLLSTVMSFPGELISLYLMNKIGRKLPLVYGFSLCGIMCLLTAVIPDSAPWAKVTLVLLAKVVMSACFTGGITYCLELFPTSARGFLLGICAISARVGGMLAPLTPILNEISFVLPPICFGGSALITGLLVILTPETKNLPLLDTIEQVEASIKTKHIKESDNLGFSDTEQTKF